MEFITGMKNMEEPWEGSGLLFVVGRDASMVLFVMETAQNFCQASTESTMIPLLCINLGSETHPEYGFLQSKALFNGGR
jgi:superoxide dismutase